ncbi:MAG: stage V sporulation protein AB [Lachnospiraceae bacterium]|nr:stage V sporulation protein AB [Lachnospiraceae bacterium]
MTSIKTYLFYIFCIFAGNATAAGYVAFITLLGVFDKLAQKLKQIKMARLIETTIILGVTLGNLLYLLKPSLTLGYIPYIILLLFGGIFTGCLAGALAETLNLFPILSNRLHFRKGLPYILICAAIGKAIGCFIQLTLF